jgi:hypothetical protein
MTTITEERVAALRERLVFMRGGSRLLLMSATKLREIEGRTCVAPKIGPKAIASRRAGAGS